MIGESKEAAISVNSSISNLVISTNPSLPSDSAAPAPAAVAVAMGGQKCNTCGGNFPGAAEYRNHFRYVTVLS